MASENMSNPSRITVAFDATTASLLEKISKEAELSQSEIMRRAIKFYEENKAITEPNTKRKVSLYLEMLSKGEHIILDVDHWLLFLTLAETCENSEKFWIQHRQVAKLHSEQLVAKVRTVEEILMRLETCNFFRLVKNSEKDFTLVLGSELPKKFIKTFLEEYFSASGIKAEIKENLAKLMVTVKR
jgi:hypothetical protein